MDTDWAEVLGLLDVEFTDLSLLETAFTHSSASPHTSTPHNERLELLGDRVLHLIVTEYLFSHFGHDTTAKMRSRSRILESNSALARCAKDLGVDRYLVTDRTLSGKPLRVSGQTRAALVEAIVGAIYLDQGLEAARAFVTRVIIVPRLDRLREM